MFKVYWTEMVQSHTNEQAATWFNMTGELLNTKLPRAVVHAQLFPTTDMTGALKFCEELRTRRRHGENLSFITMVSENPDSVGEAGVNDKLPEGYDWKKRRI